MIGIISFHILGCCDLCIYFYFYIFSCNFQDPTIHEMENSPQGYHKEKKPKDPKLLETVVQVLPKTSKFLAKINTQHK